jgi:hypothetical protein
MDHQDPVNLVDISHLNVDQKEREKQVAESAKTNSKNFWKFVNSKRKTKTAVSEQILSS